MLRGGLDAYGVAVAHQAFCLVGGGVMPAEDSAQVVGMLVVIAVYGLGFGAGGGGDEEAAGAHFAGFSLYDAAASIYCRVALLKCLYVPVLAFPAAWLFGAVRLKPAAWA